MSKASHAAKSGGEVEVRSYVIFEREVKKLLKKALTRAQSLREIAGVIVSNGGFLSLIEIRNTAKRVGSFRLHRGDWHKVERACEILGFKVAGTFHSHVASDPIPGRGDIEGANHGQLMLILDATQGTFALWAIRRGKAIRQTHTLLATGPDVGRRTSSHIRRQ